MPVSQVDTSSSSDSCFCSSHKEVCYLIPEESNGECGGRAWTAEHMGGGVWLSAAYLVPV